LDAGGKNAKKLYYFVDALKTIKHIVYMMKTKQQGDNIMKKINLESMKKEIEAIAIATISEFDSKEENEAQNFKVLSELQEAFQAKYGFDSDVAFRLTLNGFAFKPIDYIQYVIENGKPQI